MIKRLREWYRHEDQEILRREVGWTLRWMSEPWGIAFFAFYALLQIPTITGLQYHSMFVLTFQGCHLAIAYGGIQFSIKNFIWLKLDGLTLGAVWAFLMASRSLRLFGKNYREGILTSCLTARDLFPALLAAPILLLCVTEGIHFLSGAVGLINDPIRWHTPRIGYPALFGNWVLAWLSGLGIEVAITCATVLLAFPRLSWAAISLHGCWMWLAFECVHRSLWRFSLPAVKQLERDLGAFERHEAVETLAVRLITAWLVLLLCYLICWFSVTRLRSRRTRERLLRTVESD